MLRWTRSKCEGDQSLNRDFFVLFFCYWWILFTFAVPFYFLSSLYLSAGFLYQVHNTFLEMLRECLVEGVISPISAVTFPILQDTRDEPPLSAAQFQVCNYLWAMELEVREMQGRGRRLQEIASLGIESWVMVQACNCMLICMSSLCCCKELQLFFCTFPKIRCYWSLQLVQNVGKDFVGVRAVVYLPQLKPDCSLTVKRALYLVSRVSLQFFPKPPCCLNLAKLFFLELGLFVKWSIIHCLEPGCNSWNPIVYKLLLQKAQFTCDELFWSNIFFPVYFFWQIFCFPHSLSL